MFDIFVVTAIAAVLGALFIKDPETKRDFVVSCAIAGVTFALLTLY